ncbi:MAG TPA: ABC transporter substrate-binding protein [Pseudohongiella sp.]|nr:ABC transporter substrate-binding protein [Pseudohongiella sp.]HEA63997.1 ABC transporter substrate-binding protein [Pseudohongiella sp.]
MRGYLAALVISLGPGLPLLVLAEPDPADWDSVLKQATGQTVYLNAWGGEPRTNEFFAWTASQVDERFGITLQHVKLSDTAEAVSRVLAEKQAGNVNNGAIDLLWLNGENFASMQHNALLYGPWAEQLPNFRWVDADNNADMRKDFTIPVNGFESPWLRAQLVFFHDTYLIAQAPRTMSELLAWAQRHPGEFTYPRPPDFLATTFMKQALLELVPEPEKLYQPVTNSDFDAVTEPLWAYLDALHPVLLRQGRSFPASGAEMRRLMADGETALAFAFSPSEAAIAVDRGELPDSVRAYTMNGGTLANVSFLAIPFNATHKAGAMVVADFLLSPEAQLRAQDPDYLGSTSVLSVTALPAQWRERMQLIRRHPAAPSEEDLARRLAEPHPSWVVALEDAWLQRYGVR